MDSPKLYMSYLPTGFSTTATPTLVDHSYYSKSRGTSYDSLDIPELEKGLLLASNRRKKEECSWAVLISCIIIVAITQGWGFTFGVLQPWFKLHLIDAGMSDVVVVLLPTTQAMMFMVTSSLSGRLADRFGHKPFVFVGSLLSIVSVIGCSFGERPGHLFATQALQGIGAGLAYPPCVTIVTRSWSHRAVSGILACVTLYSCIAVLACRAIMIRVNHRDSLLIFAAIHAAVLIPCLAVVYRVAPPDRKASITWLERILVKDHRFWLLGASLGTSAFALLLPFIFITLYTIDTIPGIGSNPMLSILPLATVNLFGFIGKGVTLAVAGPDSIAPHRAFACALVMSALSQLLWALSAGNFPLIMFFSMINGFVGGTHLVLLPAVVGKMFPRADKTAAVGTLTLFNAPGCFFGAYMFNRVLNATGHAYTAAILGGAMFQLFSAFLAFLDHYYSIVFQV